MSNTIHDDTVDILVARYDYTHAEASELVEEYLDAAESEENDAEDLAEFLANED